MEIKDMIQVLQAAERGEEMPSDSRWIPGWKGLYAVDSKGNIWTARYSHSKTYNWRMLKLGLTKGYLGVTLARDGKRKSIRVHRAVAECFIPNPQGLCHINHKNFNPLDNRVGNLEWTTPKRNVMYSVHAGRNPKGERHGRHKLTYRMVNQIRDAHDLGFGYYRLGHMFGMSKSQMARVCKNKNWIDGGRTWSRCEKPESV